MDTQQVVEEVVPRNPPPLSQEHDCSATFEAYTRYLAPRIDAYWQVTLFEEIEDELIQWQQCCHTKTDTVSRLRPKGAAPADSLEAVKTADLPHIFAKTVPCGAEMHGWQGQEWFERHAQERERAWQVLYADVRAELHTCCIRQFEFAGCLKNKQRTQTGALSEEDVASCQQQFPPAQLLDYPAVGADNPPLTAAGRQALARAIEQTIRMKWPEAEPTRPPDDYGGIALLARFMHRHSLAFPDGMVSSSFGCVGAR